MTSTASSSTSRLDSSGNFCCGSCSVPPLRHTVVDNSSPASLLSSSAPQSNPSTHSKCTCSCLPYYTRFGGGWGMGIRCSHPPINTPPVISRLCPTSCLEIPMWVGGSGFPQKCINFVISVLLGLGKRTLAAVICGSFQRS